MSLFLFTKESSELTKGNFGLTKKNCPNSYSLSSNLIIYQMVCHCN